MNRFWPWAFILVLAMAPTAGAQVLGELLDVSRDFQDPNSTYFVADRVVEFDAATGQGRLQWRRHERRPSLSFNKLDIGYSRAESNEFPASEYDRDPELPFSISLVSPRTVRLRFTSREVALTDAPSLMLDGPVPKNDSWQVVETDEVVTYQSTAGQVRLVRRPWRIELYDRDGRLLTKTQTLGDPATFSAPTPFSFVRRGRDLARSMAASWQLAHDEMIFGCGESFTRLNKRGQKVNAYLRDAMGAQTARMYKPIPFFTSSRGYGLFVHTSAPVTFDFGQEFDQSSVIYSGDETLDLFIFLGEPKDVLTEYTAITGRSPVPPLWSFGLWMSRITYKSEEEVRSVAARLRAERIPCDVIHLDTGWFETDWQCNFEFAPSRFPDPAGMIKDLRDKGFHISLWQLPYFTSKNELFDEALQKGYFVTNAGGNLPHEDGILDFSNPDAVAWYEQKLRRLLELGVGAIKVDFGEDAPLAGVYASGRTGYYEHNLYPLRYNKVVADLTRDVTGENIVWARSAWAGSQRYPVHWGGDAENTNSAMAATLRAGLSLGMCGFTYWSHDAGGFVGTAPRELYRRWLPFAALSSHTRCHGQPPREPWEYDAEFVKDFRAAVEMRYRLMPYIFAQAVASSEKGHPLLRTLFFEFPDDPTSWMIEDQYMLGSDLLVAPLFSDEPGRRVYLPSGTWFDYQSARTYSGGGWVDIEPGPVPCVVLVREGAAIPHAAVTQSTSELNWQDLELRVYTTNDAPATALVALPGEGISRLKLESDGDRYRVVDDPLAGRVAWTITSHESTESADGGSSEPVP